MRKRQKQVLALVLEGMSVDEIAKSLDLSHGTIKCHLQTLYREFGVHNRVQLAVAAIKSGHQIPSKDAHDVMGVRI